MCHPQIRGLCCVWLDSVLGDWSLIPCGESQHGTHASESSRTKLAVRAFRYPFPIATHGVCSLVWAVGYAHSYTALYLVNRHWAPYQVPGSRVGWWELLLGKGGGVQWTKAGCPCVRHCPNTANLSILKTSHIQREGPFIHSHCFPRLLPNMSRIFPPIHSALFGCHLGAQWYEEPLPEVSIYMWRILSHKTLLPYNQVPIILGYPCSSDTVMGGLRFNVPHRSM